MFSPRWFLLFKDEEKSHKKIISKTIKRLITLLNNQMLLSFLFDETEAKLSGWVHRKKVSIFQTLKKIVKEICIVK